MVGRVVPCVVLCVVGALVLCVEAFGSRVVVVVGPCVGGTYPLCQLFFAAVINGYFPCPQNSP